MNNIELYLKALECFNVTAESEEEAKEMVRAMVESDRSDFYINHIDEVTA